MFKFALPFSVVLMLSANAMADEHIGAYDQLSTGGQAHADALYEAQFDSEQPPDGKERLTRDDIAAAKSEGGWGENFKEWQKEGYFPDAKNFGQVVSKYRKEQNLLKQNKFEASATGRSEVVVTTGSGRQVLRGTKNGNSRSSSAKFKSNGHKGKSFSVQTRASASRGISTARGASIGANAGSRASISSGHGGNSGGSHGNHGGKKK